MLAQAGHRTAVLVAAITGVAACTAAGDPGATRAIHPVAQLTWKRHGGRHAPPGPPRGGYDVPRSPRHRSGWLVRAADCRARWSPCAVHLAAPSTVEFSARRRAVHDGRVIYSPRLTVAVITGWPDRTQPHTFLAGLSGVRVRRHRLNSWYPTWGGCAAADQTDLRIMAPPSPDQRSGAGGNPAWRTPRAAAPP